MFNNILKYKHKFQILSNEITVTTNKRRIFNQLKYMSLKVKQKYKSIVKLNFDIKFKDDKYFITQNNEIVIEEENFEEMFSKFFNFVTSQVLDFMSSHGRIHCGSASYNKKFFLIIGDAHSGKSTFMTSLVYDDFDVHGDELVLINKNETVTYPRKFYVRSTSISLLPEFAKIEQKLPFVWDTPDRRIIAFDPLVVGKKWKIEPANIQAIFFIHKNHGKESFLEEIPKVNMVQQIVPQATPPKEPDGNWIGDLCNAVNKAKTYNLYLGDIDQAKKLLKQTLN